MTNPEEPGRELSRWPLRCVLALHLFVALPLAWALPVWIDEVYTLHSTSHGLLESLRSAVGFERQAPLYFGVLSLWRGIDTSPEFARLFSVLCTTGMLLVAARTSRLLFPRVSDALLPAVMALHPLVLFAALEIRVYACACLVGSIVVFLFAKAFLTAEHKHRDWIAFTAAALIAIYTHYYLGFLLAALFVGLLVCGRLRAARACLAGGMLVALAALPLLLHVRGQLEARAGWDPPRFPPAEALRFLLFRYDTLVFPALEPSLAGVQTSPWTHALHWAARLGPWILAGWFILRRRTRPSNLLLWGTVLAANLLVMVCVGTFVNQELVTLPRYATPLVLNAALVILALGVTIGPRIFGAAVLVLLVSDAGLAWSEYRDLSKRGEGRRVAEYLMSHERAGQPIAVFTAEEALVVGVYYRGPNEIIPLPRPVSLEHWDPATQMHIDSEREVEEALEAHAPGHESAWLVTESDGSVSGVRISSEPIEAYFAAHYQLVEEHRIGADTRVRLYRRTAAGGR